MPNIFRKVQPRRGSHLPILISLLDRTTGPVLELGGGMYSTPFLHWACYHVNRRLVTYENFVPYYEGFIKAFGVPSRTRNFHEVHLVSDWDQADLSESWSVAFVDHAPPERRIVDIARLQHAEYVVVHDAEKGVRRTYNLRRIYPLFKYGWKYKDAMPNTVIFSNMHDLSGFTL